MSKDVLITDRAGFKQMWCDRNVTLTEIKDKFNVSPATVYKTATRYGLPSPSEIGRVRDVRPRFTPTADMRARYESGENVLDLADDFKVSESTFRMTADSEGWQRKAKTRPAVHGPKKVPAAKRVVEKKVKLPSAAAGAASFTLRRLDALQIEAVARSGGAYAALERLAADWGKPSTFLRQCWHDYEAAV